MRWRQARQFFRQSTVLVVSAAPFVSTMPIPAAQAQFGPSPGGGGLGGLGDAFKQLTPGNQPPAKAQPQPQPPPQTPTGEAVSTILGDTNMLGQDYRGFGLVAAPGLESVSR